MEKGIDRAERAVSNNHRVRGIPVFKSINSTFCFFKYAKTREAPEASANFSNSNLLLLDNVAFSVLHSTNNIFPSLRQTRSIGLD